MCDITGIIYKISDDAKVFQRWAIADGDGNEPKPMKMEWATVKDGVLYVGSTGMEWVTDGKIVHYNPEWIKTVDTCGHVVNINWRKNYYALRKKLNATYPSYMINEAIEWHPTLRKWIVLPRKVSYEPYNDALDETKGSNILLIADEHFKTIDVVKIGDIEPEYGFTSIAIVPGTSDILAIKVREVGDEVHTKITCFDLEGKFKLDSGPFVSVSNLKYEGITFR
eukprot:TRINITY_DN1893_c0_g1_i2.p1 TRINITY_DN1893_c0_g1~~TRINITY_DN1893_c0_g1_i2.p1  ORF type:complete len:224 (-),score=53.34 TRINITY_DN1893_c0_g1_i2:310-981(-)